MAIRPSVVNTAQLVDKYINTAYDKIQIVVDNIHLIQNIADQLVENNTSCTITLPNETVTIGSGISTIDLTSYSINYVLGNNQLQVFVNGIYQSTASNALDEVDEVTIRLNEELINGDVIDIIKII